MKIKIEIDENIAEDEVVIRCSELSDEIKEIQNIIKEKLLDKINITYYKNNTEFYLPLKDILFFQTEDTGVSAHTAEEMYDVKYKLYELEENLPKCFVRVSKSTILNVNAIYSITRNLTSSSVVEFRNTHKKVYVSRHYFKELKKILLEKRR